MGGNRPAFAIGFLHTETVRGLRPSAGHIAVAPLVRRTRRRSQDSEYEGGARYCSRRLLIDAKRITDDEAFAGHCRLPLGATGILTCWLAATRSSFSKCA